MPGYPLRGGQAPPRHLSTPAPPPRHPCAPSTDLAATPPGKSICKGGQSGAPPSLQGPPLSPLARPTPVGNGVASPLPPTLTSATGSPPPQVVVPLSALQLHAGVGAPASLTCLCPPTATPTSGGATLAGSALKVPSRPTGTSRRPAHWSGTAWEVGRPALGCCLGARSGTVGCGAPGSLRVVTRCP